MKVLWIFVVMVLFCIYILLGLHISEGLESSIQITLSWIIYTLLWFTFINVYALAYFWTVVRNKTGPTGVRGPMGERGNVGQQGTCNITYTQEFFKQQISEYIDSLYYSKTNMHIFNETTKQFPCTYLNNKINTMARSKDYKLIVANMASDNKPLINIINYLKSIWKEWFDLIYNATSVEGVWFTDEHASESYDWIDSNNNPFDEIKKYDVYYWGITKNYTPITGCRTSTDVSNKVMA